MAGPTTIFQTGNHAGRPAASSGCVWYWCTTHNKVYRSDGSAWADLQDLSGFTTPSGSITASGYTQSTAKLLGRTTASTGAIEEISVGSGLTLSAGSLSASGGGSANPLEPASASGTGDDEGTGAVSGTITGWTNIGTCAVRDRDTTIAGHIYLKANSSNATGVNGVYKSHVLANGEAFIVKVWPGHVRQNYNRVGLFIGEATPGKCDTFETFWNGAFYWEALAFTNPTTLSSQYHTGLIYDHPSPLYLAIRRNSSTSYDYFWSPDGFFWTKQVSARNPGFTQDACGLFINDGAGGGSTIGAAYDWARFYAALPGIE